MTGTCPECDRPELKLLQPNQLIPRHKPAGEGHADRRGYCTGSGRYVYDVGYRDGVAAVAMMRRGR